MQLMDSPFCSECEGMLQFLRRDKKWSMQPGSSGQQNAISVQCIGEAKTRPSAAVSMRLS